MNLYLLTQDVNDNYDTYDSVVVCAKDEEDAKTISPNGEVFSENINRSWHYASWAYEKADIKVELLGIAHESQKRGVILASFNAG